MYPNYQAILSYNCVNAYGLSVGLLADAAAGKAALSSRGEGARGEEKEAPGMTSSVDAIEPLLRQRLAGTLPGVEAQLRFAPSPPRAGWKAGHLPADARQAAGLLLLYPGERACRSR